MRLFVGVELDDPLRAACDAAVRELQDALRRRCRKLVVRWVPEENLHVTLWFLGELADERAAAVGERLQLAWDVPAFTLTVAGAGAFPPSGPPGIIWLGIGAGGDRMADLYRELGTRLTVLGFEAERRPYHPHITIGRVKAVDRTAARTARATLSVQDVNPGSCRVRALTLFRSHLSPRGSRYEPILRVPLKEC